MKIAIIGTGAVGGYFGAKLALAGYDVAFLSRGKNLSVMKKHGLILESDGKKYTIKDSIITDNSQYLGVRDLVIFTVKSYDTYTTAKQIAATIGNKTIIITPQNGIDNDIILGEQFGNEKIIPGMAQIGVNTPEYGYIKHTSLGILTIGEYDGSYSKRLKQIESIMKKANVDIIISTHIQVDRWKKFIWNCTFNIISAITNLRVDQILSNKQLYSLCIDTMKEIQSIAIKEGIDFGRENIINTNIKLAQKVGKATPSTLEDLIKGKPIELDSFTGTVLKLGRKYQIQTNINKVLYALLDGKSQSR